MNFIKINFTSRSKRVKAFLMGRLVHTRYMQTWPGLFMPGSTGVVTPCMLLQ